MWQNINNQLEVLKLVKRIITKYVQEQLSRSQHSIPHGVHFYKPCRQNTVHFTRKTEPPTQWSMNEIEGNSNKETED